MNKLLIWCGLCCLLCGCSKYNYRVVFPFRDAEWAKVAWAPDIAGGQFDCSPGDFLRLQKTLAAGGFSAWNDLKDETFYSQDIPIRRNYFSTAINHPVYSTGHAKLDAEKAVIVYFPEEQKLLFFIANGFL